MYIHQFVSDVRIRSKKNRIVDLELLTFGCLVLRIIFKNLKYGQCVRKLAVVEPRAYKKAGASVCFTPTERTIGE